MEMTGDWPAGLPSSVSKVFYCTDRFVYPIRLSSTARAASRPSRIAQTTSDCPRMHISCRKYILHIGLIFTGLGSYIGSVRSIQTPNASATYF